ncbi:hypothetical protein [Burkholderia sp. BDU5]|uniref:hypothetical protein n=1 Tax=Burkholderia sp. BDU5 TaxID=1385590 RepID=UPI001E569C32|nr:hypothetical protein [Burkholderia sp. BDU5]
MRHARGRAWPELRERAVMSMFFATRASLLTILLFRGDASSSSSSVTLARAH